MWNLAWTGYCEDLQTLYFEYVMQQLKHSAEKEDKLHSDLDFYEQYLFYPVTYSDVLISQGTGNVAADLAFCNQVP